MTDDPFDELFDRWDGPSVDGTHAHSTYHALVPGFRRARARRRLQVSGAAAMVVALAVGTPLVLSRIDSPSTNVIETSTPDGTVAPDADSRPDDGDLRNEDPTESMVDDTDDPTGIDGGADAADGDAPVTTAPTPPAESETPDDTAPDPPASTTSPTSTAPPTTTIGPDPDDPTDDAPSDAAVIETAGGTITASIVGGVIVLDDVTPATGFRAEIETRGDEAEIDFTADGEGVDDIEVRIDIVDGVLAWSTEDEENSTDHDGEEESSEGDESPDPED